MQDKNNLKDIILGDLANAKAPEGAAGDILPAGKHVVKILGFTEEATYNYITVEADKKKYNLFYDFFLRNSQVHDAEVLNWFGALATIPTTPQTTLLEIANSAIGSSYTIEIRNYVSKSGKNAGKTQHSIRFATLPVFEAVTIETEEVELPI